MSNKTDHELAAIQAVEDIEQAMFEAAQKCLALHGPDPTSHLILRAATDCFVERVTRLIDPLFKTQLVDAWGR